MKVLIACEESQAICKAFLEAGHDAYSADLQECSGGMPERHIQGDVLKILHRGWDLMIAHPPCTYIANSGVKHLYTDPERWIKLFDACEFFTKLLHAPIPKKAIENPIPHKYALRLIGRSYDQLIQPYHFGVKESKATCLWLEGLNPLINTTDLKYETDRLPKNEAHKTHYMSPGPERSKERSKTLAPIADRMAYLWGSPVKTQLF